MNKPQYNLASDSDASRYISHAKNWFNYERGHETFSEAAITIRVLAEYLANQDGKTLFKSKI